MVLPKLIQSLNGAGVSKEVGQSGLLKLRVPSQIIPRSESRLAYWRVLFFVAFFWSMSTVWAQDHISARAWLEDPTGQMQWPEVTQQPVQSYDGVLSRGFGSSVIWVRLRIDPHAASANRSPLEALILRVRPVYLDDIQVFDPLAGGLLGKVGDLHHPRDQLLAGLDFLLPIARGEVPRDIWLRMESTSTRQISVQAFNADDLNRKTQNQQLIYALFVGVILIFMVWSVVQWLFSREQVIGAFGLKQAAALMYALCALGYTRVFWPDAWPASGLNQMTTVFSILAVSMAVLFHVVLIREFDPPPRLRQLLGLLWVLLPIKLFLVAGGYASLALRINMTEVLVTPMVFLCSVLLARAWSGERTAPQPLLARWVVVGFYIFLVLILALASLPGLGLAKGGEIPLYVVQAHGLATAFLILLMLQYRAHVRQEQQRGTELDLERMQLQAQQELLIRQEQDNLLAMLAHELKTPLATMQMRLDAKAHGSAEIRRAIREMDAVIERCLQTARFGDHRLQAHLERVDLVSLMQQAVSITLQPGRVQVSAPEVCLAQTDPQLMHIVLSNLLENAFKYAQPDSPIGLSLRTVLGQNGDERQICITVSNLPGAAGWPDADLVFAKYYRSPNARRQAGSGLGLFLASNLVHVMGARISYEPKDKHINFAVYIKL